MIHIEARFGEDGFPIASIRVRKSGAVPADQGLLKWAIIDTASASTYIDPKLLKSDLGLVAAPGEYVPYATPQGTGQAEAYYVSFWARSVNGGPDELVQSSWKVGGLKPRVQPILLGMDFLRLCNLIVSGPVTKVELALV